MKLQQLRFLVATADNGLNVTRAAEKLFTSQPGVSKQLRLLESELGVQIFQRHGRNLVKLTDSGEIIVERARQILLECKNLKRVADDLKDNTRGMLRIATTHTQSKYVLPDILQSFHKQYPQMDLVLHQGTSEQIVDLVTRNEVDLAIASGENQRFGHLVRLPCFEWDRIILVPKDHHLASVETLDIKELALHPLISYTYSFEQDSALTSLFQENGYNARVVFTTHDPDIIKTHVRRGMGVGILAGMAYEPDQDSDLVALPASHLIPNCTTWIGFQPGTFLSDHILAFMQLLAPQWSADCIHQLQEAARSNTPQVIPDEPCQKTQAGRLLVRSYSGTC